MGIRDTAWRLDVMVSFFSVLWGGTLGLPGPLMYAIQSVIAAFAFSGNKFVKLVPSERWSPSGLSFVTILFV